MRDVSTQAALLAVIADEQRQRDLGVLLITHDRTLATHWCGRLIELPATRPLDAAAAGPVVFNRM